MTSLVDIILSPDQLEGTSASLLKWLAKEGDVVKAGDPLLELETDKVTMEVPVPADGVLKQIIAKVGEPVEVGVVLGKIHSEQQKTSKAVPEKSAEKKAKQKTNAATESNENGMRHLIGPAVRRLITENNLQIELIPGTGGGGRVTRNDVLKYLEDKDSVAQPEHLSTKDAITVRSDHFNHLVTKKVPHTTRRKTIAAHMVESLLHTSPHVTSVFEMDMSAVIKHRQTHKQEYESKGVNLTFTAYFLAACVKAIRKVPQVNARFHADALEMFANINIGVGTALGDEGLVVPVVQQVHNKNLLEIAQALTVQTEKARTGKLTPADMKDGTFTISNHGVSGSLFAAPIIINQPQVAILGIGKLEKRVVVKEINGDDVILIKPMCYVSLSIDHRALDAFQTNQFLSVFVEAIENWR